MKRNKVLVLLLLMSVMSAKNVEAGVEKGMSMMTCSKGDKLNISLDDSSVSWISSDMSIAVVQKNGVIKVKNEGNCNLTDKKTGYIVKLNVSGSSSNSGVLDVDYSTDYTTIDKVVIEDNTVDIKTVELPEAVDEEFSQEQEDTSVSPEELADSVLEVGEISQEGNFYVESEDGEEVAVVRVVIPELNIDTYDGYLGDIFNLAVTNIDCDEVFSSDNEKVATVSEDGVVSLVGGGKTTIRVDTGNSTLECAVSCKEPYIDDSDIELLEGETYKIEVVDNTYNLPVSYEVLDGYGEVSEEGIVSVEPSEYVIIRVRIGDTLYYDKYFSCSSTQLDYWEAMQPAIEECLGTPYVFGGEIPKIGLDCSAYVSYVYKTVGLVNTRYTAQGLYDICKKIDEPKEGDMVFFKDTYITSDYITHIGIYAGNNEMYHSGKPNQKVSLDSSYFQSHLVGYGTLIDSNSSLNLDNDTNSWGYSQEDMELIWALVGQECSTSYEGALAVISSVMNRADMNYGGYGTDPLSQLTAPMQFCYDPGIGGNWQGRLGGNVEDFVKEAVADCLEGGIRNHDFVSFRSGYAPGRVNFGDNWYFNEF